MRTIYLVVPVLLVLAPQALAAFTLRLDSRAFSVTPIFGAVTEFSIQLEVDAPLAPGAYENPPLEIVSYDLSGTLAPGTLSGQTHLALSRSLSGADFYQRGGSLSFEISAVSGTLTADALAGDDIVLTFNAREIDTGEFHAPVLVLRADGTGLFASADNLVSVVPFNLLEVGDEYASTLEFEPAGLVLSGGMTSRVPMPASALAACACALGGAGMIASWCRR